MKKKRKKEIACSPSGSYHIICLPVDRLFVSSTTLSRLVFAPPLHLAILYLVLLFAFAINLLLDISSYIIKLSYLAREFVSAIKPSIRSFICLNVFQHYFLLAFAFLPSLPPLSLFLSVLLAFLPPRTLSPPVSFLLFFLILFKRECLLIFDGTSRRVSRLQKLVHAITR